MKIAIIGGGGMVGQKLAHKLALTGKLGNREINELTLADAFSAPALSITANFPITSVVADITDPAIAQSLIAAKPDVIFHLAAVVSGEAEANFEKGYSVNVEGIKNILEAIRLTGNGYKPKLIFTSSVAVYGGPYSKVINDDFHLQPRTSYGTQKAISELLLNDYSRRGFVDGVSLRFPTICIRPGKPNKAASGFFSNILREPLVGIEAILPASLSSTNFFASPRAAVGFLVHAANLDTSVLGDNRAMAMPGVWGTVGDEIDALRRVAGDKIVSLIKHEPDPDIEKMLSNWNFPDITSTRAKSFGFTAESTLDEIIQVHIDDELGGKIPGLNS
ncbi:MAG: SDR family oxidoreductase [Actinobacteria bacterium]|nr:SDR family oxidoreductase [Actinomycetota bacterium]